MTIRRRAPTVSGYVLLLLLLLPPVPAAAKEPLSLAAGIEAVVRPYLEAQVLVGVVVGVVRGEHREVHGFGEIGRGGAVAPDGDTVYEIGSITKGFTGLLLADLVRDGTVKLDQPVRELLPEEVSVPKREDREITLVDLATHTSGLPRMPSNFAPADPANPYADYDAERLYAWLGEADLERMPGTGYAYSNVGVGLLGHALARAAGTTYEQALTKRVLTPLGMRDTGITLDEKMRTRLAPGYDGALHARANWDLDALAGAGAVRSTAKDMLRLVQGALASEGALRETFDLAMRAHYSKAGMPLLGLGWHASPDGKRWWHNGQTGGYHAFCGIRPEERIGLVILANTATPHVDAMGKAVENLLLGRAVDAPTIRPVAEIDPAVLDDYPATYRLAPTFSITVTREGDRLYVQATNQAKLAAYPAGDDVFFLRVVEAEIHFERNDAGAVVRLVLHQNGRKTPGERED